MNFEDLRRLPKVLLHDHLDGGLRPGTVLELARSLEYHDLPESNEKRLAAWFDQSGSAGSLETYLEAFRHTFGVMQAPEALERVAFEAVEDLAADGVVYAEIRFAPTLHVERGMSRHEVIEAVLTGLHRGEKATGMPARVIVDALRQHDDSAKVAMAAVDFRDEGVVGFDLAGPEAGHPASDHAEACAIAVDGGLHLTIHAGEGDGVPSMAGALSIPGIERIGHGVRIVEDVTLDADGVAVGMGAVATRVLEKQIALEVSPSSNMDTKMYDDPTQHPLGVLYRNGFAVTINTDNRLMSATTPSHEFGFAVEHHGFGAEDLHRVTATAAAAAFCDEETRRRVVAAVEAGY